MRADRLLSLVLLLRNRGRMTATALAAELEVSTRTVLRDIDALSAAGFPVYAERGRSGGFALLPGFSTDLTGLTTDEAVALLTARSRAASDELGLGAQFASAIRKVLAALPAATRSDAAGAAERVLVRSGGWLRDQAPGAALAVVQRAVFAGRRLRIHYSGSWRTVDPVGLVSASGRWYLLALRDGADRMYRVSRIESAEELPEAAHRPAGVDLEQLWQRRRAEFRDERAAGYPVRLLVRPERRAELTSAALAVIPSAQPDPPDGTAGWPGLEARFGDRRHAETALWTLAPDLVVLDPPELRATLGARAAATAAHHR